MAQKYRVRYLTIGAKIDARDLAALAVGLRSEGVDVRTVSGLINTLLSHTIDNLVMKGKVNRPETIQEAEDILQVLGYNINLNTRPTTRIKLLQEVELNEGGYYSEDEMKQMEQIVLQNKERLKREQSELPVKKGINYAPDCEIPVELQDRVEEKQAEEADLLDDLGKIPTSENRT